MLSRKKMVSLAIAVFLVGAVLMFPARVAYNWFAPESLNLSGISGTVWNGQSVEGLSGDLYFTNLQWSFAPSALLRGVAAFDTALDTGAGRMDATVGIGLAGGVSMTDVTGSLSLASVHSALKQNRIAGLLNIQMQSIQLKDGWPTEAIGNVSVGNLIASAIGPETLGNFRAEFSTNGSNVIATVKDIGAVLNVDGKIELGDGRAYSLIGSVSANKDTPPAINQNLRFLGTPDANGQRQFRFEGSL